MAALSRGQSGEVRRDRCWEGHGRGSTAAEAGDPVGRAASSPRSRCSSGKGAPSGDTVRGGDRVPASRRTGLRRGARHQAEEA